MDTPNIGGHQVVTKPQTTKPPFGGFAINY